MPGLAFHREGEELTHGRCSPPTSRSSNSSSSVRFRLTNGPHRSSSPHPSQRTTAWNGCDVSSSFRAFDMVARRGNRLRGSGEKQQSLETRRAEQAAARAGKRCVRSQGTRSPLSPRPPTLPGDNPSLRAETDVQLHSLSLHSPASPADRLHRVPSLTSTLIAPHRLPGLPHHWDAYVRRSRTVCDDGVAEDGQDAGREGCSELDGPRCVALLILSPLSHG